MHSNLHSTHTVTRKRRKFQYSGNIICNELTSCALQNMLYDLPSNHTGHKETDNLFSQNFMTTFNVSSKIVLILTADHLSRVKNNHSRFQK